MNLNIKTTRITVPITRDGVETGTLSFDPSDLAFIDGFVTLVDSYKELLAEVQDERAELAGSDIVGYLRLVRKISERLCQSIDGIFGEGTSQAAFGGVPANPDVFAQFIDGVAAMISDLRAPRLAEYLPDTETTEDGLE